MTRSEQIMKQPQVIMLGEFWSFSTIKVVCIYRLDQMRLGEKKL